MAPPPRAPATYVPVIVPGFSWTGIYVGINGGYNFGSVNPPFPGAAGVNANGFLIGGTLGGNYQFGSFVVGIEGDGDYNSDNQNGFKSTWLATVRGRAGFAYDRVLFYGTGGAAFANGQLAAVAATPTAAAFPGGSATITGWTAGGGIEWAFTPNWTAKVEYLYADFPTPSIGGNSFKFTDNIVRAGINFKFW
jgi:outer membrane immunogenic protein